MNEKPKQKPMSLMVYDRFSDPTKAIADLGLWIAKSGMFGCSNVFQGNVMAMTCFAKRVDPLSLAERYHLIQGKLSMRSDTMLGDMRAKAGGKHRVISRTPELAEIEITVDGQTQRFSLSWDEAQQEPFTRNKKNEVKENYATPRSRMQMLWARVVSDAVRTMAPEIVAGSYTPEEVSDFTGAEIAAYQDAEFTVEAEATETTAEVVQGEQVEQPQQPANNSDDLCTPAQRQWLGELCDKLGVTQEQRDGWLKKRGVAVLRQLKADDCQQIIDKLERMAAAKQVEQQTGADTRYEQSTDDPPTPELVDEIKRLVLEVEADVPGTYDKIQAKVQSLGKSKIAELSIVQAEAIKTALLKKQQQLWAEKQLTGN